MERETHRVDRTATDFVRAAGALVDMLEVTDHPAAIFEDSGVSSYVNGAFLALVGAAPDRTMLRLDDGDLSVPPALRQHLAAAGPSDAPTVLAMTDSAGRHWQVTCCPVQLAPGCPATALLATEMTHSVRALREQTRLASLDPLSGLPHRGEFRSRLAAALAQVPPAGRPPVTVAFLDIDRFKDINDRHGHQSGDQVLTAFAARLAHQLRAGDTLGRVGGDEFALLCDGVESGKDIAGIIRRIERACRVPVTVGTITVHLQLSIGVAEGRVGDTPETLLARADEAMYDAKRGLSAGPATADELARVLLQADGQQSVDQATGMLMQTRGWTVADAQAELAAQSERTGRSVVDVAERVLRGRHTAQGEPAASSSHPGSAGSDH